MTLWYFVNQIGMATVCADKSDAEKEASVAEQAWPRHAPHVVMQLVDAAQLDSERSARQAAQLRIEELQAQLVRADAERCMAVSNAMRRIQAREKLTYTDKEVELIMLGWQAEFDKAKAAIIEAQTENEALKAKLAKSGLEKWRAVREAVAAEREACAALCETLQAPDSCTGVERSLWDVATMACADAIRARGSQ